MANLADLRGKTVTELRTELYSVQRALVGLRAEISNQASENTAGLKKLRREIAQIKTIMHAKILTQTKPATTASA